MITIRGKKHTFNKNVVSKLDYNGFKKHCLELPIFIQLPEKERNAKIKECYGEYFGNAKKSPKSKTGSDLRSDNVKPDGGDTRAEQSTDVGGEDINGRKYKA